MMFNADSHKISTTFGVFAILCSMASPGLQAQDFLEEIIVTAQKRDENIQEVPISITQLRGDRLAARFVGGGDVLQLSAAAPGLHVETSNGRLAPRFYLRGLGNADFTQAASQPVSVVHDEVPMSNVGLKGFPLFDMADVEVIRGPQGTLFGRNTTAGIVHIKTRRPTEETEGYLNLTGGTLGTVNVAAALGGTLVEGKLMGRVSFMTQQRGDWIDNPIRGTEIGGHSINAARAQLTWTPTEDFTAWLMHQHQNSEGTATRFRGNVINTGSNSLNANYSRDRIFFDGGNDNPQKIKSHGTTMKLDWDIGNYTITSITAFHEIYKRSSRGDIDGGFGCLFTCGGVPSGPDSTPFSAFNSPFVVNIDTGSFIDLKQLTQELRLASDLDARFNYQVGVFYFDDEFDGRPFAQSAGATGFTPQATSHIENTSWAIFGQGSYDVNEQLTLTAGIRYTDDEKDAFHVDFIAPIIPSVPINLSDDHVSWNLALAYAMSDNTQLYARVATGFRAPTVQDRIADDVTITTADSETIMSYEIGVKGQTDRFRYNMAFFYYDIDDMQLVAIGGLSNSTTLLNAQGGEGYGVEFEMDYVVTDNLILSGGFGYAETEIKDDTISVPGGPLTTVLDPLDVNGNALIGGNRFQHAPLWTANVELDYTYPFGENSELYLFTDWKLKGKTQDFLYESIEYTFGTQFEGGLRFGYRDLTRNFEVGFFARNITDEDNVIGGIDFANNTGYVNEPRIWGGEFRYSF